MIEHGNKNEPLLVQCKLYKSV